MKQTEKKQVYVVATTFVEKGYYNEDDVCRTMHGFSTEEKANAFLRDEFHRLCDENDIEELGEYESFDEETGAFHLQENEDSEAYGDWYADGDITVLDID